MLETKSELIDVITRLLWLLSVKHSTVNYPVSDYGAFTPVLPTKLYNDTSVPPGVFSELNLPNRNISLVSISSQSVIQLIDPFLLLQINGVTDGVYWAFVPSVIQLLAGLLILEKFVRESVRLSIRLVVRKLESRSE